MGDMADWLTEDMGETPCECCGRVLLFQDHHPDCDHAKKKKKQSRMDNAGAESET